MKQIVITGAGGPEKLQLREAPDPTPGPGQLRVRTRACGVNFADIMARKGLYPDAPKLPCVVGYEFSGLVDMVGAQADEHWLGKEVFGLCRFGGYSDVVVLPQNQVFEKPESLSHEQAAAIPVNYLTAWQLLVGVGALADDETVLIHNAGGGVGLAAIDIGKRIGATLIGTASPGKHEFLRQRGLHHAVDYRTGDWLAEVMRLTNNRGVELVLDPIGGKQWKQSYKALRATGRLGMFGISTVTESKLPGLLKFLSLLGMPLFNPASLMNENRSVFGVNLGHMWGEVGKIRVWMEKLITGVDDGWIRPHVDRSFLFSQAGEAHTYIEERRNTGKVVLTP